MNFAIRCKICNTLIRANGQKQISQFVSEHCHDNEFAGMTGENIELDNQQDRIALKLDKPRFNTGSNVAEVHDYWHKVPGSM